MAFLEDKTEVYKLYTESVAESRQWRKDYHEFERLADNNLIDDLDESLPEVNDGTLAAALFKLPKRIVSSKLAGYATALDRHEAWINELANYVWLKKIIPNANTMAPFARKWKDAVRKSAIYGSVPIITLFVERGSYTGSDFIVAQPQDVVLEPGKVSDYDSDIVFWDVYYTDLQLETIIEEAKGEQSEGSEQKDGSTDKDTAPNAYSTWDIEELQAILDAGQKEERSSQDDYKERTEKSVPRPGYAFCIAFQRGVQAPFYMYHKNTKKVVREWSNPDPTGDLPVHFLYCYQDFVNPYGTGIVKLAGGTQNVLDYMRQADVLATQLGFRPPVSIKGDTSQTDFDSILYAQDQQWMVGNAEVSREEISNDIYRELPGRVQMYKTSLNQLIPTGDTSATTTQSGDPTQSKTPAGVKLAAANLSIDDEDYKDNLFVTYEAVARSMINVHFANMQGTDLLNLSDEEKEKLYKTDPEQFAPFMDQKDPQTGEVIQPATNELEVIWEDARAKFDFQIDPTTAIDSNDADQALNIQETLKTVTPQVNYYLGQEGWKFNLGEAYRSLLKKQNLENVDQILTKMTDDEKAQAQKAPFPIVDPPQIRLTGQIPNGAMAQALAQGGVNVDPSGGTMQEGVDLGDIYKDPTTGPTTKAAIQQMAGLPQDVVEAPVAQSPDPNALTPDVLLKANDQAHKHALDIANLNLSADSQQHGQKMAETSAEQAAQADTGKPAKKPAKTQLDQPHPEAVANVKKVMKLYGVDERTAAAMLEAERQGFKPKEIVAALKGGKQ